VNKIDEYTELFRQLCEKSEPTSFLAITIDSDLMTNFACSGISAVDSAEVLEQMAEYLRNQYSMEEKNDQYTKH
jgi:hypothetical protein